MKILLINPPVRLGTDPYFQPIGLSIIASVLRNDHELTVLDLNTKREGAVLPQEDFDLIGISGIITTYAFLTNLVPVLRRIYDCPIVIGGGGITSAPEVYMENIKPDYGVIGEGERTIVELIEAIEGKRTLESVDGIITKDFRTKPRELVKDLDSLPSQAFDLFDMETYVGTTRHLKRDAAILATRGCPYDCAFCYHVFGRGFRYRSPKNVVDEMELLINEYGAESFLFGDECLTANKKNLLAICQEIIDRGIKAQWVCYSRVNTIDEEMVVAMRDAGCIRIGFGVETWDQGLLDDMNKKVTVKQIEDALELVSGVDGIRYATTFIFGMPNESVDTVFENIKYNHIHQIRRPYFHLAPYPGTKIFEDNKDKIIEKFGSLHEFFLVLGDASSFVINLTKWDDDEYWRMWNLLRETQKFMLFYNQANGHRVFYGAGERLER